MADLKSTAELRRMPACSSASDPIYICCNPYHWSRLCEPGQQRQVATRRQRHCRTAPRSATPLRSVSVFWRTGSAVSSCLTFV
ncbi:hypothetical protein U1Q18_050729 [Sarracenia purpurea var. burkii]